MIITLLCIIIAWAVVGAAISLAQILCVIFKNWDLYYKIEDNMPVLWRWFQ